MKACVVIPAYNEAKAIGALVSEIRTRCNLDTIVIDDGSRDTTSTIAREKGAIVIKNQKNKGKGASLMEGFKYALEHGCEALITMDGDGQHLPEDLHGLLSKAQNSDAQIIIGNRMENPKDMPAFRWLTNKFMSDFISFMAGQAIPDTQCGFRLIKKEVLEKIDLSTSKYETESEILIKSARAGFKIESIPVKTVYCKEKSSINPVIDTLRFLRFVIRELWNTPI